MRMLRPTLWTLSFAFVLALSGCSSPTGGSVGTAPSAPAERTANMSAAETMASPTSTQTISQTVVDTRVIIRTAEVTLGVDDVDAAIEQAKKIVRQYNGFADGENVAGPIDKRHGTITLRVPVEKYDQVMQALGQVGLPISRTSNTQDVTDQVVDLSARLRALRSEETQYLAIMRQATKIQDILAVRDRLASVRQEIESLDATLKNISRQASYSTITVQFVPSPLVAASTDEHWAKRAFVSATDGLASFARTLGAAGIRFLVYTPVWLPLVLLGMWIWRRSVRSGGTTTKPGGSPTSPASQ
jgi:hypothetical protein